MKLLLLLLLFPVCLPAQEVSPVVSKDYLNLIHKDGAVQKNGVRADTTNSIRMAPLLSPGYDNGQMMRKITIKQHYLKMKPLVPRSLLLGGSFNSTVEVKRINQLPALQSQYVQGRSANGTLTWRGPETGELFSYGPAVNALEFDGTNYPYDVNGRLVTAGTGNGHAANAYNSSIFRTASLTSQNFGVQGKYFVGGKQLLAGSLRIGQTHENTFIKDNKNNSQSLLASVETNIGWLTITGAWNYMQDRFSNSNRNGFLNRVYQNSVLSPVSFDNSQGNTIGNQQRSYSAAADNPFFLLEDNGHAFLRSHKTGSLVLERKFGPLRFRVAQSLEKLDQNSNEGYQPGTAFFQNGLTINREKTDRNYLLTSGLSYDISYEDYHFRSTVFANYIFADSRSDISYAPAAAYHYRRSGNDASLSYFTYYNQNDLEAGLNLVNKFYTSNTTAKANFFLPSVSGYISSNKIFDCNYLYAKLGASFNNFDNELPVDRSYSQGNLMQYSTQQALQYLPVTEAATIDGLASIHHTEWTGKLDIGYKNKINFRAEVFRQLTKHDVFPVFENGQPVLRNIADHLNNGMELGLGLNSTIKKLQVSNTLSFFANRGRVTHVENGYNFTPVAGFSDVHKALVKGEMPGVIVGTAYTRDANNNKVIGNDGFPLVNATPVVLGNPAPDFVMKMNNSVNWKKLTLAIDWEWRKGGVAWNGTQAMLDYYGRSETSGLLRNTTGYVFDGVLQNGHPNTIPVSFYDPALPVENNRWTRNGPGGVTEEYISKADNLRLNNISLSYRVNSRKYIQQIAFTLYASNIILWTAYKGADPNQLLYDQPNSAGLDFFNLPSTKTIGFNISVQF